MIDSLSREDRADEYTSLKKELEQATKNCRILSFKLRKAERRAEQLDAEKLEAERKCREVKKIKIVYLRVIIYWKKKKKKVKFFNLMIFIINNEHVGGRRTGRFGQVRTDQAAGT